MKALFLGSAPAAALGLLLGAAAQPELALYEAPPPMEPAQTSYAWVPAEPPPYAGQIPDHVRGADWLSRRFATPPAPEVEPAPATQTYVFAQYEYVEPPPADDWEAAPTYPSLDGDILSGSDRAPPPTIEVTSPAA